MNVARRRFARPALALAATLVVCVGSLVSLRAAAAQEGQPGASAAPQDSSTPASEELMKKMLAAPKPTPVPVPNLPILEKKELDGGLIVEDMKVGDGYEVKEGDSVVAFYHGTFKSDPAKIFDSAFDRGEPVGFSLNQVIQGWQKGVPGMKIGGIRKLTVPSALAYGTGGRDGIPPNSDLVFVIQLTDAIHYTDDKVGDGDAASQGFFAVTAHTIKDGDGKVVSQADAAHPGIWLPGEPPMSPGLDGMKVGGKRTIHVPKEFNEGDPRIPSKIPTNVPLTVEVELLSWRPWPPR